MAIPSIAATILPKLVEKGLDYLAAWLGKRLEDLDGSSTARGAGELLCADNGLFNLKSLTFRRKWLGSEATPPQSKSEEKPPQLMAVFAAKASRDGTAFRVTLNSLEYHQTSAKKQGKKARKDILFTGIFENPFADVRSEDQVSAAEFGVFQIGLQQVKNAC